MAQEERASFRGWVTWFMAIVCIIQSGVQNQGVMSPVSVEKMQAFHLIPNSGDLETQGPQR